LSMPSTISRAVSIAKAIQMFGSSSISMAYLPCHWTEAETVGGTTLSVKSK
jgi:hypothetical protein